MKILVFTETVTPRIEYIFKHILSKMLGFDAAFTQNATELETFAGPCISYSLTKISKAVNIVPHNLLAEKNIENQSLAVTPWRNLPAFFVTDAESDVPFDIFAASFFLISRYEEYLPHETDKHGRFRAENSFAFRNGFHEIPIVDLWVIELGRLLKQKFQQVEIKQTIFQFLPTVDIDNAFAFKYKGLIRTLAAFLKSFILLDFRSVASRAKVIAGISPDPFDSYNQLFSILKNFPQTIWFVLGGKYGRFDTNVSLTKKPVKELIEKIDSQFNVGIHPSYASFLKPDGVRAELLSLNTLCSKNVDASRQHFLRVKFPDTFKVLSDIGIKTDYSLGYSTTVGFRAGTCKPFRFFNLVENREYGLTIVPFQVMDRALLDGLNLSPENAIVKTLEIAKTIKEVGGTFVTIWHNESLSGINEWNGWENVLGEIIEKLN